MKRLLVLFLLSSYLLTATSQIKEQRLDLFKNISVTSEDIVFVGNSITNGGQWADIFPCCKVKNRGISGNTTQMVLDRLSMITTGSPKKIFLLIGVNDLPSATDSKAVIRNISGIIEQIKRESPFTQIYIQSVFPVNSSFTNFSHNKKGALILEVNEKLQSLCEDKNITYVDVHSHLCISATDNNLNPSYTNDGLHLLGEGYAKWASIIKPYVGSESTGIRNGINYKNSNGISTYAQQLISQYAALNSISSDIILYGDYTINSADWSELFNDTRVKSRGINTTIEHLCALLPNVVKGNPSKFFIYAGAYDLITNGKTPEFIRDKIAEMTNSIQLASPTTEIYIQSILPRANSTDTEKVRLANDLLMQFCSTRNQVHYVNLFDTFRNTHDDNLNSYYTLSNSDINAKGYIAWANQIAKLIGDDIKPVGIKNSIPQAAYYETPIESISSAPVWFFLQSAADKCILISDSNTTKLKTAPTPLSDNSEHQLWRFEKLENKYTIINKASGLFLSSSGEISNSPSWFSVLPSTPPHFFIKSDAGWINASGSEIIVNSDSVSATTFSFVKAPVAFENQNKIWYRVKNERTTGTGGTLRLFTGNYINVTTSTTIPDYMDERIFWAFKWSDVNKAYLLENKSLRSKYVPIVPHTPGTGSGGSSTVYNTTYPVSEENALPLIISPLISGKCLLFKKGTLGGDPLSYATRFDFGSSGTGLYSRTLDVANGRYDFTEYNIKQGLIQLVNQAQHKLDIAEEGIYYNQYPEGSKAAYAKAVSFALQVLSSENVDSLSINNAIDSISQAGLNFSLNGPYHFNKPGLYVVQYAGTVLNTKTNWYVGNTLIDNITDLGGYAQLIELYSPEYCNWSIIEPESGKFAFINNRGEASQDSGDFINNQTQVIAQTEYQTTPLINKTFTIWMDEPEFHSATTRIAIETNATANRFWSPFTGTTITAERVGYKSNSNYETNNYFRLIESGTLSSMKVIETPEIKLQIINRRIIFNDPTKRHKVFNIMGKEVDYQRELNPGIYIVATSEGYCKVCIR